MTRPMLPCVVCSVLLVVGCKPEPSTNAPAARAAPAGAVLDPDAAVTADVPPEQIGLPPAGWWKLARPCPQGTKLVELQPSQELSDLGASHERPTFQCQRPDGTVHGPSTLLYDGQVLSSGYYRDGERHGHQGRPESKPGAGDGSDAVYDHGVGIGTWHDRDGDRVLVKEHRGPGRIYFTERNAAGARRMEGLLVEGVRTGPWIFGDGADERTVVYTEGVAAGDSSITGVAECDAAVARWRRCQDTKQGGRRYEMAEWLASYIWFWELVPELNGRNEPQCVSVMPLVGQQLEAYGCAP